VTEVQVDESEQSVQVASETEMASGLQFLQMTPGVVPAGVAAAHLVATGDADCDDSETHLPVE